MPIRHARRFFAAGFLCLCLGLFAFGGWSAAWAQSYLWEPTGIEVEGEGSLPFFGGLGSGNQRGPRVRLTDLDDDGDLDLYVLDKDARLAVYRNDGDASAPRFVPNGDDLLGVPISDWFLFDDLDGDGDLDLLGGVDPVGNAIGFFRNVGTPSSPVFSYEPNVAFLDSVQVIPRLGNTPTLADFDADGDHDMFYVMPDQGIGAYHRNDGTVTSPNFRSQRLDYGGLDTFVGGFGKGTSLAAGSGAGSDENAVLHGASIPLLFDTDADADMDLLIGDQFNENVWLFANDGGTDSAEFRLVTQDLLDLPVDSIVVSLIGCEGGDLDGDGLRDLLVAPVQEGRLTRDLYFYRNVGAADSAVFAFTSDTLLSGIDLGARGYPALGDVDADGDLDMVVSHAADPGEKGLVHYENTGTAAAPAFRRVTKASPFDAVVHDSLDTPSPTFADMDGDGDLDLLVGQGGFQRQVLYFENVGTPSTASFAYMGTLLDPVRANIRRRPDSFAAPTTADLDRDGDLDLLVGEGGSSLRPQMYWYRNLGIPSLRATPPVFEWVTSNVDSAFGFDTVADSVTGYLVPLLIDTNGDGYLDIVIGSEDGRLREYRSRGEGDSLRFDRIADAFAGVDVGRASAPAIIDIDDDGDRDLLIGEENGGVNFFRVASEGVPTVTSLAASPLDTTIAITWTVSENEGASFTLLQSEGTGAFQTLVSGSFTGGPDFLFEAENVAPGNVYAYLLEATLIDSAGATVDVSRGPIATVLPIPPFSLVNSDANAVAGGIRVTWTVSRDFPGLSFRLTQRIGLGDFLPVAGAESLSTGSEGSFDDPQGNLETVYRLEAFYRKEGTLTAVPDSIFPPALITGSGHIAFKAYPARPNPSTGGYVEFQFDLPEEVMAGVAIYDVSGRRVAEVRPRLLAAGLARSLVWDGKDIDGDRLATGLYVYRLTAGAFSQTGRFVHLR